MPRIREPSLTAHRQRTEEDLLDAFAALLREEGYASLTLAQVAARAGIVRNTIYNYFADKEAMLVAFLDREVARFMASTTVAVDNTVGAQARLSVFCERLLSYFAAQGGAHHDLIAIGGEETRARLFARFAPAHHMVARILREGIHEGVFRQIDPDATAPLVLAVLGVFRVPVATGQLSPAEATERVLQFVLPALQSSSR